MCEQAHPPTPALSLPVPHCISHFVRTVFREVCVVLWVATWSTWQKRCALCEAGCAHDNAAAVVSNFPDKQ